MRMFFLIEKSLTFIYLYILLFIEIKKLNIYINLIKIKESFNMYNYEFGMQLHITDDCDQRCKHCYVFNDKSFQRSYLSFLDVKKIVENFCGLCEYLECNPSIALTGGDPLIHTEFWEIVEYLHQKNISFDILGNPFHLNLDLAKRLKALGCEIYQISIDGMKTTHDFIRKTGSFDASIEAINILNKAGIESHVMMTVSQMNYKEVIDVIRYVVAIPVGGFAFARYCPTLLDRGIYGIPPYEYRKFLAQVWDVYNELVCCETKFFLKDHLWIPFLYEKGLFQTKEEDVIYEGCGCAMRHVCVLTNGDIYACRRFNSKIGNALQDSFKDVFFSENIAPYRDFEKMECYNCKLFNYCRGCPAVSYGTYGSFYKKDPQCWR